MQIRENREHRNFSQSDLAEKIGTKQSVISRYEKSDYGRISVTTLLKIAKALDVSLVVKLTSFDDFLNQHGDVTPDALIVEYYEKTLSRWDSYEQASGWSPGLLAKITGSNPPKSHRLDAPQSEGQRAPSRPKFESEPAGERVAV